MSKQNKKLVLTSLLVIVVLFSLFWLGRNGSLNQIQPAKVGSRFLTAGERSFDFGSISMAAGSVSHLFKIRNSSDKPVQIDEIYTSCMCTAASLIHNGKERGPFGMPGHGFIPEIGEKLNPDEEADVKVVFDPAAHGPAGVGLIERVVYLENDSGTPLELSFKAVVTP